MERQNLDGDNNEVVDNTTLLYYTGNNSNNFGINASFNISYTPISFDFSNATWGYVILFILSMFLSPVLIILSKVLKKPIGLRARS